MYQYKYELIRENRNSNIKNTFVKVCLCCVLFVLVLYTRKVPYVDFSQTHENLVQFDALGSGNLENKSNLNSGNESDKNIIVALATLLTTASSTTAIVPDRNLSFFLKTSKCRMPFIDPFSPMATKLFHPVKYSNCTKDEALITSIYNDNLGQYLLHINTHVAKKYWNSTEEDVSCCYRQIVRSGSGNVADNKYKILPCANFHKEFVVPKHIDAMIVDCKLKSTNKNIQQDAFSFIQEKRQKANTLSTVTPESKVRKLSVLLIGIDSLSRINFRRNMPFTLNYLRQKHWFELKGYNKVGDNTFPNLMALLTGLNETTAFKKCKPSIMGGLDKCDFIWKRFKEHGYLTAFAEDTVLISTFNYLKKGFTKEPTDYYLRPMTLAIEERMKVTKKSGLPYCVGRKHYAEYIYDYAMQFANRYTEEPIFGLFWTNSFSHNKFDTSAMMDTKMLEYFQEFELSGIFESNMVIFFSDHGMRFGPLLNLPEGFFEERWPMFFMSLPKWFKTQHPNLVRALDVNQNRLVSPYDIHMTLENILQLHQPGAVPMQVSGCATCQSIFREIPENRTCSEAGIPDKWCSCISYEIISPSDVIVKAVTKLIINEINTHLLNLQLDAKCSKLHLKVINKAHMQVAENTDEVGKSTYRIDFVVKPKEAHFEAYSTYDSNTKTIKVRLEDISRLNRYEKHAKCIGMKNIKKFCICKK